MPKPKWGKTSVVRFRQFYLEYWREVESLLRSNGIDPTGTTELDRKLCSNWIKNEIRLEVEGTAPIELKGLPKKARDQSKRIDVCLSFVQTLSRVNNEVVLSRSNIRITYLQADSSGKDRILESFHYDYAPEKEAHPVYHVQLSPIHVVPNSRRAQCDLSSRLTELPDAPRVPTAPMDFPGIITMLVADHLPDGLANISKCESAKRLPSLPCGQILAWENPARSLYCHRWYPKQ